MDSEIRRAATLPSAFYTDETQHRLIVDRALVRGWQLLVHQDRLKSPGTVLPLTLLPGCVDEALLLTRDEHDQLHCLSNVCTHRAHLVASGEVNTRKLRCRYHGRRFALDGKFLSMPEFEGCEDFPTESDDLPRLPLKNWGGFLFTSIEPAHPFDRLVETMEQRVGWLPIEEFQFAPERSRDYLVEANWIAYCDNYLEGFHIPYVHPALNDILDYGDYNTELFELSSLQLGIAKDGEPTFDLPPDSPDAGRPVGAYYFFVFPNVMFNFYPWGLSLNVVRPLAVDRTRVSFRAYVWRPELLARGAGAELDRVEREDETVVEAVQVGLRSRLYDRGRYSPTREQAVHHFHRYLAAAMADE